ncbi:hypothetical protein [Paenibacillus beijingensis]|uniref:DUF4013 domain-containing protein n=1 Tax=Paenibacillus beijingensis TaxID=1126833 RepID=A0A0D5NKW6_9BACL|nr:hypothetical protein [Paenibacillus beijingensis]AJY75578.1 hypothetical protein VN24_14665 [Paenibacillus beijingensis]
MKKLNVVLVRSGVEAYREIVSVALYSMISSVVLAFLVMMVPLPFVLALFPLLYMPLVYGVYYAFHRKMSGKRSRVRDIFSGAVKGFVPAVVFGFLMSLLAVIVWSTWWYYGGKDGMIYLALAVFQTYFVAMALASQFYTFQLVLQEEMGIFKAMGESVKLFFRYPGYTIGAFLQMVCVAFLLLLTVVGFFLLFNGLMAIYQHKAAHNVLRTDEPAEDEVVEGQVRA